MVNPIIAASLLKSVATPENIQKAKNFLGFSQQSQQPQQFQQPQLHANFQLGDALTDFFKNSGNFNWNYVPPLYNGMTCITVDAHTGTPEEFFNLINSLRNYLGVNWFVTAVARLGKYELDISYIG